MRAFLERLQGHLRGAVDSANTRLCESTKLNVVDLLGQREEFGMRRYTPLFRSYLMKNIPLVNIGGRIAQDINKVDQTDGKKALFDHNFRNRNLQPIEFVGL